MCLLRRRLAVAATPASRGLDVCKKRSPDADDDHWKSPSDKEVVTQLEPAVVQGEGGYHLHKQVQTWKGGKERKRLGGRLHLVVPTSVRSGSAWEIFGACGS
jgi:hypothetical protein